MRELWCQFHCFVLIVTCGICICAPADAQTKREVPRTPWGGYSFPPSYDAEIADPDVHRVLYENEKIMFLEVANPPGLDVRMHGHPYPSVFARDAGSGPTTAGIPLQETHLDANSPFSGKGWGQGPAPVGLQFPRCTTSPPEAPHKPINHGPVPAHFYRLEFRRLDGEDFANHWKEWYPWMLSPARPVQNLVAGAGLGPNFSEAWPYPRTYDSILAAPNNYQLLFEDGHVRVLEVTVRPGETTPVHGHPYASVLAFDTNIGDPEEFVETRLDPKSLLKGQGAGHGPAPSVMNMKVPTCTTLAPEAPHTIHNKGSVPLHYYRIEFKRIDGDAFQANWQQWYPWMKYMKYMR